LNSPRSWEQYSNHLWGRGRGGGKKIRSPLWRGQRADKAPGDLLLYAQTIFKRTPDYIIETGTLYGGSALFFGDMLLLTGGKKVFAVDIGAKTKTEHPMVEYVTGSSVDPAIVEMIRTRVKNAKTMVILDSDHSKDHVSKELKAYCDIVTPGQYLVVEDSWADNGAKPHFPYYAINEFLESNKNYKRYPNEKQFIFALTRDGWLYKRA
jgi:cephalosporin hydroxylase